MIKFKKLITPIILNDVKNCYFCCFYLKKNPRINDNDLILVFCEFTDKFGIDGIHLDNGQAWPQIMVLDVDEMYRNDSDGTRAYSDKQIFFGEVVLQDEKSGFWGSSVCEKYPNPFLIKLSKTLWNRYKDFLILAESMSATGFEGREISIIKSVIQNNCKKQVLV